METIDLNQTEDNKDYYYFTLYIPTCEILRIKNAGCTACVEDYLEERYNINLNYIENYRNTKIFFNGTNPQLDLNNVYKKYHKYFKEIV